LLATVCFSRLITAACERISRCGAEMCNAFKSSINLKECVLNKIGFASKVLNLGIFPQKSHLFGKSRIDNKELNKVLPQKCLNFSTFEAKPIKYKSCQRIQGKFENVGGEVVRLKY